MLNKWRNVQYTDDGCNVYQCLQCQYEWEARTSPDLFCPHCGTKWIGEHECREHGFPKWDDKIPVGYRWPRPKPSIEWEVQCKMRSLDWDQWSKIHSFDTHWETDWRELSQSHRSRLYAMAEYNHFTKGRGRERGMDYRLVAITTDEEGNKEKKVVLPRADVGA